MAQPVIWGEEIAVSTSGDEERMPALAALANGRFGIATARHDAAEVRDHVMLRVLSGEGTLAAETDIETIRPERDDPGNPSFIYRTTVDDLALAASPNGNLFLGVDVYESISDVFSQQNNHILHLGTFSPELEGSLPYRDNYITSTVAQWGFPYAEATALPDGRVAFVWHSEFTGYKMQVLNADGTAATDAMTVVTDYPNDFSPDVTALPDGRIVLAAGTGAAPSGLEIHLFNADGTLSAGPIVIPGATVQSTGKDRVRADTLADGNLLLAWVDAAGGGVMAQILDATGTAVGGSFTVAPNVPYIVNLDPVFDIAALADGRFVVTWHEAGDGFDVMARIFNADGTASSDAFLVTGGAGDQMTPHVATLADGRFVIAWQDESGGEATVGAQVYDPRLEGTVLSGTAAGDDYAGSRFADTLFGVAGDDRLYGYGGNDLLHGGDGDDTLAGGKGSDRLYGGNDSDRIYGQDGNDLAGGGAGDDFLYGETGHDRLYGQDGDDFLSGGMGNDWLYGEAGTDRLFGGEGRDVLNGGLGNDIIDGGAGQDFMAAGRAPTASSSAPPRTARRARAIATSSPTSPPART